MITQILERFYIVIFVKGNLCFHIIEIIYTFYSLHYWASNEIDANIERYLQQSVQMKTFQGRIIMMLMVHCVTSCWCLTKLFSSLHYHSKHLKYSFYKFKQNWIFQIFQKFVRLQHSLSNQFKNYYLSYFNILDIFILQSEIVINM